MPFISLLSMLAAQASEPPSTEGPPASPPRIPLDTYFSDSDYPREARRKGEEGTVAFKIEIGANGRVTNCTITRSSGSVVLDSSTCRLAQERFRFRPARDEQGRPVPDMLEGLSLTWRLPR